MLSAIVDEAVPDPMAPDTLVSPPADVPVSAADAPVSAAAKPAAPVCAPAIHNSSKSAKTLPLRQPAFLSSSAANASTPATACIPL